MLEPYIEKISTSTMGKDVRSGIVEALKAIDEVLSGSEVSTMSLEMIDDDEATVDAEEETE